MICLIVHCLMIACGSPCRYVRTKVLKLLEALLVAAITALAASTSVLLMTECAQIDAGAPEDPVQVIVVKPELFDYGLVVIYSIGILW